MWQGAMNDTNDTQVREVASSERIVARTSIHEDVADCLSRCVTSNSILSTTLHPRPDVENLRATNNRQTGLWFGECNMHVRKGLNGCGALWLALCDGF